MGKKWRGLTRTFEQNESKGCMEKGMDFCSVDFEFLMF